MPIIPDIYSKIGVVLQDLRPSVGAETFMADNVVEHYIARYSSDDKYMRSRQVSEPASHSLAGYVRGMIHEYYKITDGADEDRPAIDFVAPLTYRFR